MEIKIFRESELKAAAKLCRQNMDLDVMPDFLFREKVLTEADYNPKLTLLAYDDKNTEPVGFIQGVIKDRGQGKIGYVKLLCVDSNYRRQGIATNLYKHVEEIFKNNGIKTIRVYETYPNYFMPGVDPFYTEAVCFFERNGFKKFGDTSNLNADSYCSRF